MSRKLVQTVASMTAKQLRVAVAMLAALALGVGGAAAAVGSLNAATVANDTVATQTVTADDADTATTSATDEDAAEVENEAEDGAEVAATSEEAADDEGTTVESDRNQTDCLLPAELLVTKAEAAATADGDEQAETADTTGAGDESDVPAEEEAELPTYRNHGEFVSSIARNKELARHAEAVRWAAQSDCGKPVVSVKGAEEEATSTDEDAEASELSAETESQTSKRSAKADQGKRGNGHAKGKAHGQGNGR